MNISQIGVRYAKSVFEIAVERNEVEQVYENVKSLAAICSQSEEFNKFLHSPVLKPSEKSAVFSGLFGREYTQTMMSMFDLLLHNKRESFLSDILRNFSDLYRKRLNIKSATITSAQTLDNDIKTQIETMLQQSLNSEVEFTEKVNEKLIGGFILRVDDKQVDASIAAKLENIKRELLGKEL